MNKKGESLNQNNKKYQAKIILIKLILKNILIKQ